MPEYLVDVHRVHDEEDPLVGEPVHEEVVEHRALLVAGDRVADLARGELRHVVRHDPVGERDRPGPVIEISPMWLTSKSPTAVRTLACSATIPSKETGMRNPANGTILPARADVRVV